MKDKIEKFIASDKDTLKLPLKPLEVYKTLFEQLGFREIESCETNGWQVDFWWKWTNDADEKDYTLTGSLYYGDYQLTKEEE